MSAEGTLMEPTVERSHASGPADVRLVSVIVPVVERADDLVSCTARSPASSIGAARSTSSCSSSTAASRRRRSWWR